MAVHAAPNYLVRYAAPVSAVVGPSQSQYHAQDELGQYSFGHQEPNQARSETKDAYGVVRGSYRYAMVRQMTAFFNCVAFQLL